MMTRKEVESKANSFIESFGMKLLARFIMPILISVVGYLIADTLTGIKTAIATLKVEQSAANTNLWSAQRTTAQALSAATSRLEVLYERVNQVKSRTDEVNKQQSDSIDGLSKRLDDLLRPKS